MMWLKPSSKQQFIQYVPCKRDGNKTPTKKSPTNTDAFCLLPFTSVNG